MLAFEQPDGTPLLLNDSHIIAVEGDPIQKDRCAVRTVDFREYRIVGLVEDVMYYVRKPVWHNEPHRTLKLRRERGQEV